ncbi:hypothetical protein HBI56_012210 [Parastagonospora nodorum]|nr:hypothetical protein HBH53_171280 [Parastagonospora nodorum]KAH4145711.1 hypothetical protein HBH45_003060 [Parastagonospora nodorum]KAH4213211.1 hypothetical protein HBI95_024190 [Parastagonospora nodorum]KAH4353001.1 hypothetical protein HBH98_028360 [Parastagonospora nodorum]KAH4387595.1 hypothetical protein HBH97_062790 [Parastagonospora nodorum]
MGTSLIKPILKTLRSITFECLGQAIWAQSPVVIHCALRHTTTADQLSIHWSRTDHQSLFCSVFPMLRTILFASFVLRVFTPLYASKTPPNALMKDSLV